LPSELFRIVISCKIVNSSIKFKFIRKISVVQKKFLAFFELLRGPDIARLGAGSARGQCNDYLQSMNLLPPEIIVIQYNILHHMLHFARTSTMQKRAFAAASPSIWNGLPLSIRSVPRTFS